MNSHTPQSNRSTSTELSHSDPSKWPAIGVLALFMITLPIILGIVILVGSPASSESQLVQVATLEQNPFQKSPGKIVYENTCQVCHGADATGVAGLGKPLRNSGYIQDSDDNELFRNIAEGRYPDDPANTTGVMMPPRGAQNITDAQVTDVMTYLRSLQDTSQPRASIEAWIIEKPSDSDSAVAVVGRDLFVSSCSACHGPNGEGMEGIGKPFTTSQFVKDSTDKEIITLIKMGRPIWDAANTTGVDMPPKGGNPAITDDELNDIITYIRSISKVD